VSAVDGRYLDLGHTGAFLNGVPVTGKVLLRSGYSVFSTSDSNWITVSEGLITLDTLRDADSLYPYNHRYLIEGYLYPDSFTGERIYSGVEEYFGQLLEYVAPELFDSPQHEGNLGVYTLDTNSDDTYFKVKVDKTDASWQNELFSSTWLVHRDSTNDIYVKAVLNTSNSNKTPRIDSFSVRVV